MITGSLDTIRENSNTKYDNDKITKAQLSTKIKTQEMFLVLFLLV
jgi:hypothetical protein